MAVDRGLFARKSVAALERDAESHGLTRTLGPVNLLLIGVGAILGAGIYVMPGAAAAQFAGPGVMISFVLAGVACALTGLCYAELASSMPVSGSAYTYAYAAIGEVFAWAIGWLILLEFGLAASTLAVGFSGYLASLMEGLGHPVPRALTTAFLQPAGGLHGEGFVVSGGVNLVAAVVIALVTLVLTRGVRESAWINNLLVAIKVGVLAVFIVVGVGAVTPDNWVPLIPPNEGGFTYGWEGVMRAASILFFAYLGFEVVSTAASETKNPQRDLPIGILGALGVCTVLYIAVAAVMTGIVPFRELGVPDPIAVAIDRVGQPGLAVLVKLGALVGLVSVLLVNAYGQSRVAFAMGRDGLLPPLFARLNPVSRTPVACVVALGVVSAAGAAFLPLTLLSDLVSVGVALSFSTVAVTVMWLRTTRPDLNRPFRVPGDGFLVGRIWIGWVPLAAIVLCWVMMGPVLVDIGAQALAGHVLPASILGGYALVGALIYVFWGARRSHLRHGGPTEATEVEEAPIA